MNRSRQQLIMIPAIVLFVLALAGCEAKKRSSIDPVDESATLKIVDGPVPTEQEKAKLLSAKEKLFTKLSGRLMDAMNSQGPAGAIEVCQKEAKRMASEIGEQERVRIGRSGVRLRNSDNKAPAWARSLVEAKTDSPTFVRLSNQQSAALLPIKLQSQCLMCHGPRDRLAPDVLKRLDRLYPADQATGFTEGELRGWFWVESRD